MYNLFAGRDDELERGAPVTAALCGPREQRHCAFPFLRPPLPPHVVCPPSSLHISKALAERAGTNQCTCVCSSLPALAALSEGSMCLATMHIQPVCHILPLYPALRLNSLHTPSGVQIEFPIALVDRNLDEKGPEARAAAQAFMEYCFTPESQREFAECGFRCCPSPRRSPCLRPGLLSRDCQEKSMSMLG